MTNFYFDMKQIKSTLLGSMAFAAALFLASCGGEEEIITPPAPTVTIEQGTEIEVNAGEEVLIKATAVANANLSQAVIYKDQVAVATYPFSAEIQNFSFPDFRYTTTAAERGQSIVLTFEATDVNAKSGEANFTINVKAETPLAYERTGGILSNRIGPDSSAWDLTTNTRLPGSATGDMQNPSIATGSTAQQWIKGWDSETTTMYLKANDFNYDNATVEGVAARYAEGTGTAQVRELAVGDIYIAKLRNKDAYAVIKITRVDEPVTAGSRVERIEFTYKKVSANSGQ
jgi:hypothetical protein